MTIKQLSIFIENKSGTLIKVLDKLSKAGIQIIASTVADTKGFGIYRILCDNPLQALSIDDTPGMAAQAVQNISKSGVNILYLYSFLWKGKGVLVFRTDDNDKAMETITLNKMNALSEMDLKA